MGLTARGSAAADSGKTHDANQNETRAKRPTHTRAEGGRLQPLVGRVLWIKLKDLCMTWPERPLQGYM